jgi:hypothetical protein
MASQFQEICLDTTITPGTSRLCLEYYHHDSNTAIEEVTGHPSLHQANLGQARSTITESTSQFDDEDSGSYLCDISSPTVYSPPVILQESSCEIRPRLGSTSPIGSSQPSRASMVVRQSPEMEWSFDADSYPDSNDICGRQQHRMGCCWDQQRAHGY